MSHSTYKLGRETFLCFTKLLVSKSLWTRGGGERMSRFSFKKKICLTVPKKIVGEPFCVSQISGSEKVYGKGGKEEVSGYSVEFFCLTVPKIS